ncbi:MAG: S-methyl-5-thioribose-1-phosphate isomerase [Proteobacteria bacterium]|nr:MAG: S-methyl-5-thioribose-1-phosphate isomerase [Pseudomonadota bacterium]
MSGTPSKVRTLYWDDDSLMLLDQRVLPHTVEYLRCRSVEQVAEAIRAMVIRGAPAIGVAAAYGVVLAAGIAFERNGGRWREALIPALKDLKASRPTAVNLQWAVDLMVKQFPCPNRDPRPHLLRIARDLESADVAANETMGEYGADYLVPKSRVITHCNAGALATAGYGTALGVIRSAWRDDKLEQVFATETRPWLQGARLTAWELHEDGIPVTVIADSAAAQLMRSGTIGWVITGADRIAANGDVANKIGTYSLAVCAHAHNVPFMVVAPLSTIDRETPDGDQIPIEHRDGAELLGDAERRYAPRGVAAYNPVFDITPAALIDVLVTEMGAVERPDEAAIAGLFRRHN